MGIGSSRPRCHGDSCDGQPGCCIPWVGDDASVVAAGGTGWTALRSTAPETVRYCRGCREDGDPAYLAWPERWPCSALPCSPGAPSKGEEDKGRG